MAFWVPYSDFKIGVEKTDILEYIKKVRANDLPIKPQKKAGHRTKDTTQQSFAYFIKAKMKLDYYQDAEIEIGFKSKKATKIYLVKVGDQTPEEHKGEIDKKDSIDLSGIDISGLDFEGVTFNSTDLNGVNFDGTLLHNSSILYTDLSGSKTITKSIVNSRTTFSEGGLSAAQREQLKKQAKAEKYLKSTSIDVSKEALGAVDDPSATRRAIEVTKAFFLTMNPRVSLDEHITSPDKAFDVLRYHYLKTGDETLLNEVEQTSKKYISTEIASALKDVTLHSPGYTAWLFTPKSANYAKKIKQIISDTIEGEIQKDEFLKKQFLIGSSEIRKTLMGKILTKDFIGEVTEIVDKLSATGNDEAAKKVKRGIEQTIVRRIEEETNEWKESQTIGKEKWTELQSLSKRKKFKNHSGISPNAGSMVTRALPDWCSPLQPSSYPAVDPYDQEAILKDLALKQDGAKFLASMTSAGTGASAGVLLSAFASTGKTTSAVAGVAVAGLTKMLSSQFIDTQFKYENHRDYDNKMGDKLLELGIIYRSMKPHIDTLGIGAINIIALKYMGATGYLQDAATTYQKVVSSVSTYLAYRDFYATKDCITKQSTKATPTDRKRPGSDSFDTDLKNRLFSNSKFFTSLFVGAALLVVGIVLATSFPAAIPALTALVTKGVSLKIGAIAVGAFSATAGFTYLSYGAVSKGVDHIKNFIKSRSSKARLAAQGDEIMADKIKASDTIKRVFSKYKLRKIEEERSKKHGYNTRSTKTSHVDRLKEEPAKTHRYNLRSGKTSHAERIQREKGTKGTRKISK